MANWFTSSRPGGLFVANLIAAQPIENGRMTLFNRRFTVRDRDNRITVRALDGIGDYRDVLVTRFGLHIDDSDLAEIAALMAEHQPDEAVHQGFV
jgi:arylamine N-acetyltransferase